MEQMGYFVRAGTVISQAVNALVFNGHPDTSLSSRAYLERHKRFWWWIWLIAETIFSEGHCEKAFLSDVRFADDIKRIDKDGVK